jgi:hypothetical protein
MTATYGTEEWSVKAGWRLAPARLPREDLATLRKLYVAAHTAYKPPDWIAAPVVTATLHADREDTRKLALAKLGAAAPHVLVSAQAGLSVITVTIYADVNKHNPRDPGSPTNAVKVAAHRFRRTTPVGEWTRILGRHCRHAFGVLAHLRAATLTQVFS